MTSALPFFFRLIGCTCVCTWIDLICECICMCCFLFFFPPFGQIKFWSVHFCSMPVSTSKYMTS
uniref:Uncharacterized protein n=1 Tax=Rhizophora mucronata TaxID=61149 RepID=A0A2P2J0N5_RHIMU